MANRKTRIQSAFDLRAFLSEAKATGELKQISGADWNCEIGALTELFAERTPAPALLFERIKDYPDGDRVLSNILFSPRRQALALGVASDLRGIALVEHVKKCLAALQPLPPEEVTAAPALENILTGDQVNVLKFPAPQWHEKDGGRYIGTFDAVIRASALSYRRRYYAVRRLSCGFPSPRATSNRATSDR